MIVHRPSANQFTVCVFVASCEDWDCCARACASLLARLTGAGWGGCAVALVAESQAESFIKSLTDNFYSKRVSACFKLFEEREDYGWCECA